MKTGFFNKILTALTIGFAAQAQAVTYTDYACCPPCCDEQFWVKADYLYWKLKDTSKLIPLAVESPTQDLENATVVLGDEKVDHGWRSGGKLALGTWLDCDHCLGAELSGFYLPTVTKRQHVSSSGLPGSNFQGVPYINATTHLENIYFTAFPGLEEASSGLISYKIRNQMSGVSLKGILTVFDCSGFNMYLTGGTCYLNFGETFTFKTSSPSVFIPENVNRTKDTFGVNNNFYGFQMGTGLSYACNCLFVDLKAKIALGKNFSRVRIHGHFITNGIATIFNTVPIKYNGGIFALPSNIGTHRTNNFCYIPEVSVDVGYTLFDCLRFKVGYSFLYISKVLRPNKQIDRELNITQSRAIEFTSQLNPTPLAKPKALHRHETLWAHGLNVGVEFSF